MYLLDTHTLLWSRLEPSKLTNLHQEIICSRDEQKLISTISIWEVSLKYSLGKLELGGHTPEEFLSTAKEIGFQIMAPMPEYFASFYRLKPIPGHKDPFDRMLIWQAIQSNLTLLSSDTDFPKYKPEGLRLL